MATNTLDISASNLHSYLHLHALPLSPPLRYLTCKFSPLNIGLFVIVTVYRHLEGTSTFYL